MDLLLRVDRSIAQRDIGDILDIAILGAGGVRPADDVDIIFQRHAPQLARQARRVVGELVDRFHRRQLLRLEGEKGQGEELGKDDEVRPVVSRHVDEIFDVADELVEILHRARLQLAGGEAHAFHAARHAHFRGLVGIDIGVAPDQMRGMAVRLLVFGQVIFQHAQRLELVLQLEADHLVAQLAADDFFQIVARAARAALGAGIAGHAAGDDDAVQVQLLGQFLALVIEPLAYAQPAQLGIDGHLIAVKPLARRAVPRAKAVGGDLLPVMLGEGHRLADAHRGAIAHHLAVIERDEAAIGEIVDLPADGRQRIIGHAGIGAGDQSLDAPHIRWHCGANLQTLLARRRHLPPPYVIRKEKGGVGCPAPPRSVIVLKPWGWGSVPIAHFGF